MVKVKVRTGRGTGRRKLSDTPEPKARPSTKGKTRSTGRGTGSRKLADTPEPKSRPSTKGKTRSTGRGTGSRKGTT